MDPPFLNPISVVQEGKVTGTMGLFGKGECKVEGQLVTPRTCQNAEALLKISVDNSKCEKMVANIKFNVKRSITAYGYTTGSQRMEFKDQ